MTKITFLRYTYLKKATNVSSSLLYSLSRTDGLNGSYDGLKTGLVIVRTRAHDVRRSKMAPTMVFIATHSHSRASRMHVSDQY